MFYLSKTIHTGPVDLLAPCDDDHVLVAQGSSISKINVVSGERLPIGDTAGDVTKLHYLGNDRVLALCGENLHIFGATSTIEKVGEVVAAHRNVFVSFEQQALKVYEVGEAVRQVQQIPRERADGLALNDTHIFVENQKTVTLFIRQTGMQEGMVGMDLHGTLWALPDGFCIHEERQVDIRTLTDDHRIEMKKADSCLALYPTAEGVLFYYEGGRIEQPGKIGFSFQINFEVRALTSAGHKLVSLDTNNRLIVLTPAMQRREPPPSCCTIL